MKLSNFQVPESLDMKTIILTNLGEKKGKSHLKHIPKYHYFIHLIYSLRRDTPKTTINSYTHINMSQVEDVITSEKATPIRDNLIEWGVIERHKKYCAGLFSMSYRLSFLYRFDKTILVVNDSEKIQVNNTKRLKKKTKSLLSNIHIPEYRFLRDCLLNVSIDSVEAQDELLKCLLEKRALKDKEVKSSNGYYYIKQNRTFNLDMYNTYSSSIQGILNGEINFDICNTTNRIHSSVTSFPSILRPYLTYEGNHLIYLDISSSQPYFLYKILKNQSTLYSNYSLSSSPSPPIMSSNFCKDKFIKEVDEYGMLLESGKLYSYFETKLAEKGLYINQDKVKKGMFKHWLYCKVSDKKTNVRKQFRSVFPNITLLIDELKKDDYKILSNTLCKSESELMTRKIIKRVINEIESPFVVTIHDGILTTPELFDEVYNIMLEELQAFVGIKPHIKIVDMRQVIKDNKKIPLQKHNRNPWIINQPKILPKRQPLYIPLAA